MSKIALHVILLPALLCTLAAGSAQLLAQDGGLVIAEPTSALEREQAFMNTIASETDQSATTPAEERAFQAAISAMESSQGAYAPGLPEHMLSLGRALQERQRYTEAVEVFKRGVHLARVNEGLYCAGQIPLLQGEIASLIALGNYSEADDRQRYLYRVQVRSLASGPERADALIEQADWQYRAFRQGLGWQGFGRLINMWELYRLALNDIIDAEGETSPRLLAPLQGMLRTQYLIAAFEGEAGEHAQGFGAGAGGQQDVSQFYAYRARSYKLGQSVIMSMYEIQRTAHGEDSAEAGAALVMLGDWALWHDKKSEASQVYANALAELAAPADAQSIIERMFAEPVPLPDLEGVRPLPPAVSAAEGNILLEFGIDPGGRVFDLVRLDENGDQDASAIRLMRALRKTRFRPRYEAGQAVETDKVVRAYDVK